MSEEQFKALIATLSDIDVRGRDTADENEAITEAVRLLTIYREALTWVATHDNVSVAHARRAQRVCAGAAFMGRRPADVLREGEPK